MTLNNPVEVHPEGEVQSVPKGEAGNCVEVCRRIVKNRTAEEHDGVIIDMQSANAVVTVHDAIKPHNQERLRALSVPEACSLAWRLLGATE